MGKTGPDPDDPRRCTATAKGTGNRCLRWAAPGCTVCVKHGGGAPQIRAAGQRKLAEEHARKTAAGLGLPRRVNPHQALLEEVHRSAGVVAWLDAEVAHLDSDHAATSGVVRYYGDERDRLVRAGKAAVDAGVSERLVQLEEDKGRLVAELLMRIFADGELGLTAVQQQAARVVAARHLRALPEAS